MYIFSNHTNTAKEDPSLVNAASLVGPYRIVNTVISRAEVKSNLLLTSIIIDQISPQYLSNDHIKSIKNSVYGTMTDEARLVMIYIHKYIQSR